MRTEIEFDELDFDILRRLSANAALSNKQIAADVGLAPSSYHERLKNLQRRRLLLGFHAEVDFTLLGLAVEALLFIQCSKLDTELVHGLMNDLAKVRHVRSVFLISGHFDLVAHVVVCDMEQLKRVISEHFNRHACVTRTETAVVFNRLTQHEIPSTDATLGTNPQSTTEQPLANRSVAGNSRNRVRGTSGP